jgi:hypothetical protein
LDAANVPGLRAFKFLADRCVKAVKVAIDFHRIILDYDFSGYVSNRSEIKHRQPPR